MSIVALMFLSLTEKKVVLLLFYIVIRLSAVENLKCRCKSVLFLNILKMRCDEKVCTVEVMMMSKDYWEKIKNKHYLGTDRERLREIRAGSATWWYMYTQDDLWTDYLFLVTAAHDDIYAVFDERMYIPYFCSLCSEIRQLKS